MAKFAAFAICALYIFSAGAASAKDYPIFDGQRYNGVFYPRVDIIEWGKPPHLDFHVYSKDEPLDIEAKSIERNGKRVLLVNYFFTKRKEKVCRSVIAPANFNPETSLYFYRDKTDPEYDNVYVSMSPMKTSKNIEAYPNKQFSTKDCAETTAEGSPSSGTNSAGRGVASEGSGNSAPAAMTDKTEGAAKHEPTGQTTAEPKKHELIDYQNNAMPFNF